MVYCGVQPDPVHNWRANLCLAVSPDLVHWEKRGVMPGEIGRHNNKDGVLFPDPVGGKYWMLHRPFYDGLPHAEYSIDLASAPSLHGPWTDHGEVLRAYPNPRMRDAWVGGGSVPVALGGGRYLHIYHTGNYLNETDREYDLDAAIFDFTALNLADPRSFVTARLEPLMVPETPAELRSRSQLQVGNVLFACGSYEYKGWLYIVYGGADTYTLAARVKTSELLSALDESGLRNPFT
jgi:beta-1,2-mannobiose phosphorylase / 1,2-beta-oligomannan phosphorylase